MEHSQASTRVLNPTESVSWEAVEDARQLAQRAASVVPIPELTQAVKTHLKEIALGRAMVSEGMIAGCLLNPLDAASAGAIQEELGMITGKKVREDLCNSVLLAEARSFIG